MIFCILIFFFGLIGLFFVRDHYLMSLLNLEFLLISIFYISFFFFGFFFNDFYFCIIFLVMGVCDGVLGLSLLVYLVRSTGNDYFNSLGLC